MRFVRQWALALLLGAAVAVPARGVVLEPLTHYDSAILNEDFNPSWSADGSRVLFARSQTCCGPYHPIWWTSLYEVVLGSVRSLATTGTADPVQSVAGEYACTVSLCASTSSCEDSTYVAIGIPAVRLTFGARHDYEPAWSPDGLRIAFTSDRTGNNDIWIVSRHGGSLAQLTHDPADDGNPVWSPDGSQIAFASNRMGNKDVWIAPAAGGNAVRVTEDPTDDWDPTWSPDGRLIAFASNRSGNGDIYVVRVATGQVSQVTDTPDADREPAWSPDGNRIVFVSSLSLWLASDLRTVRVEPRSWSAVKRAYR
jgi:Tol biopolymer transport system component